MDDQSYAIERACRHGWEPTRWVDGGTTCHLVRTARGCQRNLFVYSDGRVVSGTVQEAILRSLAV